MSQIGHEWEDFPEHTQEGGRVRCFVSIAQVSEIEGDDITTWNGMRVEIDIRPFLVALREGVCEEEQVGRCEVRLVV